MIHSSAAAPIRPAIPVRLDATDENTVLGLKPTAKILLRTQEPCSMLHAYITSLRRAKTALETVRANEACPSLNPLIKIAISTISTEVSSAKMSLLACEELLKDSYSYIKALETDSALYRAAELVIKDFETDRLETITLMQQVRELCRPYQA
jgi:hypothetical protein